MKRYGFGLRPYLSIVHHNAINPAETDLQPCEKLFRIGVIGMVFHNLRQKRPKQAMLLWASGPGYLDCQITAFRDLKQMLPIPFGNGEKPLPAPAHDEEVVAHAAAAASLRRFWASTNAARTAA